MLEVQNLSMRFGGLLAVDEVSLDVQEHEIVSIIGPNGAGKTTVFNCMSGFYKPTGGKILFEGKEVQGKPDYKISRLGMVRTFQHVRLFSQMTVVENLLVAQHRHLNTNLISGLIKTPSYRAKEQKSLDRAAYWLDRVGLLDLANREAGNLAYGQQRRLEIARCMVTEPKLLMLDEPVAGMSVSERKKTAELLHRIIQDRSVLVIEHDMKFVEDIAHKVTVLHQGRILSEGSMDKVQADPKVIEVYLGH